MNASTIRAAGSPAGLGAVARCRRTARKTSRSSSPRRPRRRTSGLFGHILPLFKAKTGIDVKVVAQGTGQALDTGRRGDADVVFVHAKAQEEKFVADGFGVKRFDVMYNDFVLIGPKTDPAGVKGGKDIVAGLEDDPAPRRRPFVSRGDKSGTHAAELALWKVAGLDPAGDQARLVSRDRPGHGRGAQHRRRRWAPTCSPTAAPGSAFKNKDALADRGRGRQAAVQPVRHHAGEPGQASAA